MVDEHEHVQKDSLLQKDLFVQFQNTQNVVECC